MKQKKFLMVALAVLLVMAMVTGCASNQNESEGTSSPEAAAKEPKQETISLHMGAGSAGGAQSVYVGAAAVLVSNYAKGVELVPEMSGTGGSTADLAAMINGEAELCFVSNAAAQNVYKSGEAIDLRTVWGAYPQQVIIVTNNKSITDITQLEGKLVSVGPMGSTPESSSKEMLKALGVNPKEILTMPWSDCFNSLAEGKVDAVMGACGNPTSALIEAETKFNCHWVSLTEEQKKTICDEYSHFAPVSFSTNFYKSLAEGLGADKQYDTLGIWSCVYASKNVPEDAIYELVKAILEHPDELVASSSAAAEYTTPESFKNAGIPLHRGALKYYQEKGIDIPTDMIID
jgi:TRAP transporter TAXI family solute receptor